MHILLIKLIKWFIQVRLLIERCYVIEKNWPWHESEAKG